MTKPCSSGLFSLAIMIALTLPALPVHAAESSPPSVSPPASQPVTVTPYRFPYPADTTDWPQWRGPQRDSISSEKNLNLDWNKTPPRDTRQADRKAAVAALAKIAPSEAQRLIPSLVDRLRKGHWFAPCAAAEVLQKMGSSAKSAAPDLVAITAQALNDRDWALVILAAKTTQAVDPARQEVPAKVTDEITGRLLRLMDGKDEPSVRAAVIALGAMGPAAEKAGPRLIEALHKPYLTSAGVTALVSVLPKGPPAVPLLVQAAKSANETSARREIQSALVKIKTGNVLPTVEDAEEKCLEGKPQEIKLKVRDEDDVADLLWFFIVTKPVHGKAVIKKDMAAIEYTADQGYVGKDTFTWKARDAQGESPVATVTLEVKADTAALAVKGVKVQGNLTGVTITFSKPLDQASAETAANYTLDPGVKIEKAELDPKEGRTVTLTTEKLEETQEYTLTVSNVRDRTGKDNTVKAEPVKFQTPEK